MLSTPIHRLPDFVVGQFEFALKAHGFSGSGEELSLYQGVALAVILNKRATACLDRRGGPV
jgi:hypothetical protein